MIFDDSARSPQPVLTLARSVGAYAVLQANRAVLAFAADLCNDIGAGGFPTPEDRADCRHFARLLQATLRELTL